jgi:Skp family chaperone for outer membrane proteins
MGPMGGGMMGGPQMPSMNRLAEMDVDIIIEAAPDMITLQHEQFEQLTQMAGAGIPIPPDVILEASQLKNKRQLVDRLKEDMDANAKLAQAQQEMEQMQKALQQLQAELQKAQMPKPESVSPLDMARAQEIQAKTMDMARKAERDDALAGADIALKEAQAIKAVQDAMRPPPNTGQPRGL